MKRRKWDRDDYKVAGCVSIVVVVAFVILTMLAGIFGTKAIIIMLLLMIITTGFFVGWALKNKSRWSAFWQAAGVILTGCGFLFAYPVIWMLDYRVTIPIPASYLFMGYIGIIVLCFILSLTPKR
ncbi:MAG: hypothetical protein Q4C40_00115 [Eubacteriales bacterium]|nr:hypothetical protein [Eubacteriales bacterium]